MSADGTDERVCSWHCTVESVRVVSRLRHMLDSLLTWPGTLLQILEADGDTTRMFRVCVELLHGAGNKAAGMLPNVYYSLRPGASEAMSRQLLRAASCADMVRHWPLVHQAFPLTLPVMRLSGQLTALAPCLYLGLPNAVILLSAAWQQTRVASQSASPAIPV